MEYSAYSEEDKIQELFEGLHLHEWEGVYEVTYGYEPNKYGQVNKSLFEKIGGLRDDEINNKQKVLQSFMRCRKKLGNAIDSISDFDTLGLDEFYVRSLTYHKNLLRFSYYGAVFELQKTGLFEDDDLEEYYEGRDKESYYSLIKSIDKELFGDEVREKEDECIYAVSTILKEGDTIHERGSLSTQEYKRYANYLQRLENIKGYEKGYDNAASEKKEGIDSDLDKYNEICLEMIM